MDLPQESGILVISGNLDSGLGVNVPLIMVNRMKTVAPLFVGLLSLLLVGCGPKDPPAPPPTVQSRAEAQRAEFFGPEVAADTAITWKPTGLGVKVLAPGEGELATASDTVLLHYTGRLKDGTIFDDTRASGKPSEFALGKMIPGMVTGVSALKPGGHAMVYVPPSLGYGSLRVGKIPPVSGLVFDVELLSIKR